MTHLPDLKTLWNTAPLPRRDFIVAALLVVLIYGLAWRWNLAEQVSTLTRRYEFVQLDELPLALFAAALASAWFSRRRMRDLLTEITRRLQAEKHLEQLLAENRALAQHVQQVQETERRRMAREIHDDMGQYLAAIRLSAAALHHSGDPLAVEHARRIAGYAEHMQATVKALLHHLRPVALDEYGLADAMRHLVHEWVLQYPGVACDLELENDCHDLPDALNTVAYRIVQEALTNIGKHAHASHVEVEILKLMESGSEKLLVNISDNGIGFEHGSKHGCYGLVGMRERVEATGGSFQINSESDAGVRISVQIPLAIGT